MKSLTVFILLVLFSIAATAQAPPTLPKNTKKTASTKNLANEKEEFQKAVATADLTERIAALRKFIEDFPKSKEKNRALELVTSARAALADEKLRAGEKENGIELFKLAVRETPKPVSDKLFTEIVLQIPHSLFFRGERLAANDVARLIEEKADGYAKQLLALATFYLGLENVAEAKRLAEKAVLLEPNLPAAYQTLGAAHRLDFQFDESVASYTKALELDANSAVSKRSLAEMKRAVGKPAEAIALYREILSKDASDAAAQTGLILALFDADNKAEAEIELAKALETNPNNLFLLTGTAYWYAAREQGERAVELAEKAVNVEPRYTWAQIALARGLMQQKRFFDAEKTLLAARQYGDFPTLDYELAAARFQAGFYREAAEILQRNFSVKENSIVTKLGGRVTKNAKNFTELLAAERRASIFQPIAADNSEIADKLKSLLDFSQKTDNATDEATVAAAADEFIKGEDKMKLHRQLFAASQLLQKRKALPKVLELSKAAVGGVETGLDAPNSTAAILADELYQSRQFSMARGELVIVPEVPRQMLSNILRGKIEDIAGGALLQDNKPAEAIPRLVRAVGILPEKSAWWRASMWRLGTAYESAGNLKEALNAYIKSYTNGDADLIKYGVIESVYQKVNGNAYGLETKIGAKPASIASNFPVQNVIQKSETQNAAVQPTPETKPEALPSPSAPETAPPVEIKPTPQISNQEMPAKTETAPAPETKPETAPPSETKIETKQPQTSNNPSSEAKSKSLFEPIIISVPKVEPAKKQPAETNQKSPDESAETRPRVIRENAPTTICKLTPSEETVSIVSNGGTSSFFLNLEGEGNLKEIKIVSSSAADIEITPETESGNQSNRAFFSIKSISRKTGVFTVAFELPCGKKEITVEVR